jgi:hypothetical protein
VAPSSAQAHRAGSNASPTPNPTIRRLLGVCTVVWLRGGRWLCEQVKACNVSSVSSHHSIATVHSHQLSCALSVRDRAHLCAVRSHSLGAWETVSI